MIKWVGFVDPTPMWASVLRKESCNAELNQEIDDAIARVKLLERRAADETADDDSDDIDDETAHTEDDAPAPPHR